MIEKITYKKKLFAIIVRGSYRRKKGINFFSPSHVTQQFGFMNHKRGHIIKHHKHKKRITKILSTTEVIIILKGSLRVDFYKSNQIYLKSKIINKNDIILLSDGGHGFEVIKDVEMIEVKQGPYSATKDKIKFEPVNKKKIKLSK